LLQCRVAKLLQRPWLAAELSATPVHDQSGIEAALTTMAAQKAHPRSSSFLTSAARCGGTGVARASYPSFRHFPIASVPCRKIIAAASAVRFLTPTFRKI